LTFSYQIVSHSQNIKGKLINNRTTENDEAFFCQFLDSFFCERHRSENSIILLPFQAFRRCLSNVSPLEFFFFFHVDESAEKVSRYEPEIDLLRAKIIEELFFCFLD
jgi:hypothetical protein